MTTGITDRRYELMKERFMTLSLDQLKRMRDKIDITLFDVYNYCEGKYCPMGIALGADELDRPTDKDVKALIGKFYQPTNMLKGVEGNFYHGSDEQRRNDLLNLIDEITQIKMNEIKKLIDDIKYQVTAPLCASYEYDPTPTAEERLSTIHKLVYNLEELVKQKTPLSCEKIENNL